MTLFYGLAKGFLS